MRDKHGTQGADQVHVPEVKSPKVEGEFLCLSEAAADDLTHIDLRAEKIRMLKKQVRDGTYAPDLKRVALILVHDEGETLVGS